MITSVFFDLDGTLADTAPDLAAALNFVLRQHGSSPLPYETIRPHVSNGSIALMKLGFGEPETFPRFEEYRQLLLNYYAEHIADETKLFPDMHAVLDYLDERHIKWGVVTNKPGYLTMPLIEKLHLHDRASSIVSGDTLQERKPDPAPLLLACKLAQCDVAQSVYIGDALRDVEAGNRAGMHTLIAMFGYIGVEEQPQTWGADNLVQSASDIIHWIESHNNEC